MKSELRASSVSYPWLISLTYVHICACDSKQPRLFSGGTNSKYCFVLFFSTLVYLDFWYPDDPFRKYCLITEKGLINLVFFHQKKLYFYLTITLTIYHENLSMFWKSGETYFPPLRMLRMTCICMKTCLLSTWERLFAYSFIVPDWNFLYSC